MRRAALLALLAAALIAGCGSTSSTGSSGPHGTPAGDYAASKEYCSSFSLATIAAHHHVAATPQAVATAWSLGFKNGAALRQAAYRGCLAGLSRPARSPG
jgi:hypothetical protein